MSKLKIKFRSAVMGVAGAATLLAGLPLAMQAANAGVGDAPVVSFLETFDGTPAAPQAWDGEQWDVTVHSREREWQDKMAPVNAVHGMNCAGGMENRHLVEQYADAVFACNGHVMTAVNSGDLGYAVAYLTPNHMVDFSSGTATIKLDVSTLQSSGRDWWDLWISPYEENVQLVGESWYPDLNGAPRHGVLVSARDANLHAQIYDNFTPLQFPAWPTDRVTGNPHLKWSDFLVPDAKRRDTVEIQISRTHLKIGFPAYNQWFVDTDIPALSWSSGTVQIGHHSYTPQKDCGTSTAAGWNGACEAGTWHWDNVSISPAIPFTIIKSDKREVTVAPQLSQGTYSAPQTVTFAQPAPANANLRFTAYDDNTVQVSLDGGVTWVDPARQAGSNSPREWHYNSFWMPIPQGVQTVMFRGRDQINIPWRARDISIWSRTVTTTGTTPTTAPATTAPATTAPATTAPATTAPATTAPANNNQNSAGRFATIPAGQALPSEATCASQVRPAAEIRSGNATYNATRVNVANTTYTRVTGNYSGTTDEILQWAACKWGIDEDIVRAQVAQESWWQQTAGGDMTSDQNACYPAVRTTNGSQCPESLGLGQVRFAYHSSAFVDGNAYRSSAYNVDYLYGLIRSCLDGEMTWLNTVERGSEYAAGDLWGCLGVWFSGRWHTPAAEQYIQNVQSLLNQRIWTTSGFIGAATPTPPTTAPATTAPATTAPATTAPATTVPAGSGTPTAVTGTWQRIDPPVDLTQHGVDQFGFKSMESSPSRPGTIYVGTSYEGLWKTTNGGTSWVKTNTGTNGAALDRGRLWALAVDPTNADIVYTTPGYGGGGLYKSTDGGVNWTQMLPQSITSQTTAHVYSIDLDPADPRHILLGSHQPWGYPNSAGVIESRDGGVTWIVHQPGAQWGWGNYALFLTSTTWLVGTQENGFWRTTNSGGSWTQVSTRNMSHGGTDITRGSNGTLYVGAVNTLLRSTNGGSSFTEVGPFRFDGGYYDIGNDGTNLWIQRAYPVQGMLSNATYFTSPIGDGVNWTAQPGSQMFGNGPISMVFDPTTRTLYSANLMAGIWKLTLSGGTTPTPTPPTTVPAPVTTTPAPVTTAPSPVTTAPAPVTTAPAPVTTAPAPVTTAPAPVTTAPAPVTTVPAPVTTVPVTRKAVTPTGVAARPTATRTITVTWTAVPGRTYEIIYSRVGRTGSRVVRNLTQGSFSITRLVNGATYVFQVREKVDGTTSTWSAPVSAKATSRIV